MKICTSTHPQGFKKYNTTLNLHFATIYNNVVTAKHHKKIGHRSTAKTMKACFPPSQFILFQWHNILTVLSTKWIHCINWQLHANFQAWNPHHYNTSIQKVYLVQTTQMMGTWKTLLTGVFVHIHTRETFCWDMQLKPIQIISCELTQKHSIRSHITTNATVPERLRYWHKDAKHMVDRGLIRM